MKCPNAFRNFAIADFAFKTFSTFVLMAGLFFSAVATAGTDSYRLSGGDTITFDFLDDAELPVTLTVASDGETQFPLSGAINIQGLTIGEALKKLRLLYPSPSPRD